VRTHRQNPTPIAPPTLGVVTVSPPEGTNEQTGGRTTDNGTNGWSKEYAGFVKTRELSRKCLPFGSPRGTLVVYMLTQRH